MDLVPAPANAYLSFGFGIVCKAGFHFYFIFHEDKEEESRKSKSSHSFDSLVSFLSLVIYSLRSTNLGIQIPEKPKDWISILALLAIPVITG